MFKLWNMTNYQIYSIIFEAILWQLPAGLPRLTRKVGTHLARPYDTLAQQSNIWLDRWDAFLLEHPSGNVILPRFRSRGPGIPQPNRRLLRKLLTRQCCLCLKSANVPTHCPVHNLGRETIGHAMFYVFQLNSPKRMSMGTRVFWGGSWWKTSDLFWSWGCLKESLDGNADRKHQYLWLHWRSGTLVRTVETSS